MRMRKTILQKFVKKYINLEIENFCSELNGAFSILILDYKSNKVLIVTDKLGIIQFIYMEKI